MVIFSLERKTMGRTIFDHQVIAFKLADMAMGVEASRLLVWKACWLRDHGKENVMYASMSKAMASETANKNAQEAVQIFGGKSIKNFFRLLNSNEGKILSVR